MATYANRKISRLKSPQSGEVSDVTCSSIFLWCFTKGRRFPQLISIERAGGELSEGNRGRKGNALSMTAEETGKCQPLAEEVNCGAEIHQE
jgi:hypothetical protein